MELSFFGKLQHSKSASPERFSIAFNDLDEQRKYLNYTDFDTGLLFVYTPNRNVFGYGVEQRYGEKLYSTYMFKYTKGVSGALSSKFDYDKLQFLIKKPITLWSFGMLNATLEMGKIFGKAPLPVLTPTPANQWPGR